MDRPAERRGSSEGLSPPEPAECGEHPWDRRIPLPRRLLNSFRDLTLDDEYGLPLGLGIGATIVWTILQVYFTSQRLGW